MSIGLSLPQMKLKERESERRKEVTIHNTFTKATLGGSNIGNAPPPLLGENQRLGTRELNSNQSCSSDSGCFPLGAFPAMCS